MTVVVFKHRSLPGLILILFMQQLPVRSFGWCDWKSPTKLPPKSVSIIWLVLLPTNARSRTLGMVYCDLDAVIFSVAIFLGGWQVDASVFLDAMINWLTISVGKQEASPVFGCHLVKLARDRFPRPIFPPKGSV